MIVVARFSFPHEAHIAKASLEAAGIESCIADEHTINTQWLYSNAIGGVRLMVAEQDLEQAENILSTDFSDVLCAEQSATSQDHCPKCDSVKIEPFTKGKRSAFLVFILLGFPLFFYKHGYRCKECGHFCENAK
ncbi:MULTISPECIES: DUF2007 domain-containing protein [unclassified Vibrio]|uniref:putative signal transducing protein n=1 Tax=unclassified Vibrio TaxID=2614977 RepID=UPI001EF2363C|nr:DUF2007 domain-containing protein [Vibrio sp. Of14-4]MCG7488238.1 DUF2007 domain-containing protein [Vibrio sp. Of14-4]